MQLYVADYLADTSHLSTVEHGAYLLLIMNYWQRGKPLPAADDKIARIARMTVEEWLEIKSTIMEFFVERDGMLCHKRIDRDLQYVAEKSEQASAAGRSSAAKRWGYHQVTDVITDVTTDVKRTSNHTDTDTDTDKTPQGGAKPRTNLIDKELTYFLRGAEILNEPLTALDFIPEFKFALRNVEDSVHGRGKFLKACENLARAPDDDRRCVKSVTWLLEDRRKSLTRVVTWAAKTNGHVPVTYDHAPDDWRPEG